MQLAGPCSFIKLCSWLYDIQNIEILHPFILSDHRSVAATIKTAAIPQNLLCDNKTQHDKNMNWNKAPQQQKLKYQQASKIWLWKIPLFEKLISCDNPMCKKQKHIGMLEKFYNNIAEALKRAASEVLTNSPKEKRNVPGWNKDVRDKHEATRQAYLYWIDNHKPKSGPLFDIMKESKKEFKYALRACRKSQQKCKADAMTEALRNRSPKKFWQSISKSKKSWLPSTVGGETGNKAVTVMWRKHFSTLLNSSKNYGIGNFVHQNISSHSNLRDWWADVQQLQN